MTHVEKLEILLELIILKQKEVFTSETGKPLRMIVWEEGNGACLKLFDINEFGGYEKFLNKTYCGSTHKVKPGTVCDCCNQEATVIHMIGELGNQPHPQVCSFCGASNFDVCNDFHGRYPHVNSRDLKSKFTNLCEKHNRMVEFLFKHPIFTIDFCGCGQKLIHDGLSEKFGDYCPNENCLM